MTRWEEYWWNNITGPQQVVRSVVDGLLDKKPVILRVPSDLPWRHTMRRSVEALIKERHSAIDLGIRFIDAVDMRIGDADPGRFLLEQFGLREVQNGYRSRSGQTIQNYLIKQDVLKNLVIWVKGLTEAQAEQWIKFCRDYKCKDLNHGLFVIECSQYPKSLDIGNMARVTFSNHVRQYDLQLFNSILLDSQIIYNDDWKRYIAALASHLCVNDAEVSELYIRLCDFKQEEPIIGFEKILECGEFERRGADEGSTHILALCRHQDIEELERRTWAAQLLVLFPMIELRRTQIIVQLYAEIEKCLSTGLIKQYGEVIYDPADVEFGTLVYMMALGDEYGYRTLYVPDENLRREIHFLRDCRNTLAHGSSCTVSQVKQILGD